MPPDRDEGVPAALSPDHPPLLKWRGIAAIAFAALVFFWPHLAAVHLVYLWGGYSLFSRGRWPSGADRVRRGSGWA